MARVRFTADFDYRATGGSTIAYKKGMVMSVTRRCATLAIAAGKAERVGSPYLEEVASTEEVTDGTNAKT